MCSVSGVESCRAGHSSLPHGRLLLEQGRDALTGDAEQFCNGLDRETFGAKRKGFGRSELCAGGLEGRHVRRQQLHHSRSRLGFDELCEPVARLESISEITGSLLKLATAFDVVVRRRLEINEGCEKSIDGVGAGGHEGSQAEASRLVNS